MARLRDDTDISLEEDRFEVDCWRYVGEPVGLGAKGSGKSVRAGMLDLGKSGLAPSSEKSEGWFGVSIHTFLHDKGDAIFERC